MWSPASQWSSVVACFVRYINSFRLPFVCFISGDFHYQYCCYAFTSKTLSSDSSTGNQLCQSFGADARHRLLCGIDTRSCFIFWMNCTVHTDKTKWPEWLFLPHTFIAFSKEVEQRTRKRNHYKVVRLTLWIHDHHYPSFNHLCSDRVRWAKWRLADARQTENLGFQGNMTEKVPLRTRGTAYTTQATHKRARVKQANKLVKRAIKKRSETKDQHKYACSARALFSLSFSLVPCELDGGGAAAAKKENFFSFRFVFWAIRFSFLPAFSPRCLSRFHSADAFSLLYIRLLPFGAALECYKATTYSRVCPLVVSFTLYFGAAIFGLFFLLAVVGIGTTGKSLFVSVATFGTHGYGRALKHVRTLFRSRHDSLKCWALVCPLSIAAQNTHDAYSNTEIRKGKNEGTIYL